MPPVFDFRCKECGATYETHVPADRLDSCATDDCDGIPRRIWNAGLLRENIRAVPKGGR